MEWSQMYVAGTSPSARSRHTCNLVGNKLFVFGGGGEDGRVFNDLFVLDIGYYFYLFIFIYFYFIIFYFLIFFINLIFILFIFIYLFTLILFFQLLFY